MLPINNIATIFDCSKTKYVLFNILLCLQLVYARPDYGVLKNHLLSLNMDPRIYSRSITKLYREDPEVHMNTVSVVVSLLHTLFNIMCPLHLVYS